MIGRLKGVIAGVGAETALIDVGGVGYEVHAASRTLDRLAVGAAATLSIETIVREDMIRLYAFPDEAERQCFRLLQGVQGVGARNALGVLQVLPPAQLLDAVAAGDDAAVARAHGVGKKIAQRIVTELSGKTPALMSAVAAGRPHDAGLAASLAAVAPSADDPKAGLRADAVSALSNLGYEGAAARAAVARVLSAEPGLSMVGDIIKRALKELAPA